MVIRVSDKKKNYSKVTKLLVKPNLFSQNLHKINYFIGFLNVDMFSMLQQNKIFTVCIMNIVVLIVCVISSILLLKKKDLIVTGD